MAEGLLLSFSVEWLLSFSPLAYCTGKKGRRGGKKGGREERKEGGRSLLRANILYYIGYSRRTSYINRLEFFCLGVLFSTSLFSHLLISELIHGCSIYTLFCNLILCYLFHCAACPSVIIREHFRVAPASLWHELTFADVRALCLQGVYDHRTYGQHGRTWNRLGDKLPGTPVQNCVLD